MVFNHGNKYCWKSEMIQAITCKEKTRPPGSSYSWHNISCRLPVLGDLTVKTGKAVQTL